MHQPDTLIKRPLFRKPYILEKFPELVAAESTRHGGVSTGPYTSLNLGGSQDLPENILKNNRIFFGELNIPFEQVAKSHQVHGTEIKVVTEPGRFEGFDALITNIVGIHVAVTVADCTPILIYDPVSGAVAAIHAGWRGTIGKIVEKTVAAMRENYGTEPQNCYGYVGTCIDECTFEVGDDVARHFDDEYKRWDADRGKFFVNLKAANSDQLVNSRVRIGNIEISPYSTVTHNHDYFSHRFENGVTGRLLATIGRIA